MIILYGTRTKQVHFENKSLVSYIKRQVNYFHSNTACVSIILFTSRKNIGNEKME